MNNWPADDPNIGGLHQPGAAFTFNGALYYFGTDSSKNAFFAGMDTSKLNPNATIPIPSANLWSSGGAQVASAQIRTNAAVAAAVLPASLQTTALPSSVYTFWQDGSNGVMAANWTSASLNLPFTEAVSNNTSYVLQDSKGNRIPALADVAASTLDDSHILVGTVTDAGVYIAVFIPPGTPGGSVAGDNSSSKPIPWTATATAEWNISLQQLQNVGPVPRSTGNNLSLEWYSIDGSSFWLALSLFDGNNAYVYWLPFDIISLPYATLGYLPTEGSSAFNGFTRSFPSSTPISITRDLVGRLCFYWATNSKAGAVLNSILQPPGKPAPDSLIISDYTPTENNGHAFKAIKLAPTGAFAQSSVSVSAQITNDPNIGGNTTYPALPAAQVVIADDQGDFRIMSSACGLLQQLTNLPAASVSGPGFLVLRGIVDGPIPIPNENTMPYKFPGGYSPDCGDVTYGSDSTKSQSNNWDFSITAGVKSTGTTTKGIGPAWDISLTGAHGWGFGQTRSTQMLNNTLQPATLNSDNQSIEPFGTLVGYGISIQYNLFRLLQQNSDGTFEVDPNAPQFVQLMPFYSGSATTTFIPYDVVPGNLQSYTREAWNTRMQQLGYPGTTYFEDVVLANAIVFENGNEYLDFSWSNGSESVSSFYTTKESYVDSSWNLTAQIWAGFGGGEEVSMFGFGEAVEAQFLLGLTFDMTATSQTDEAQGWGITLDKYWCPETPADGPGIESYTWRLYFLPGSSQWLDEFLKYRVLPLSNGTNPGETVQIDPTSKPWRIVYEVVTYSPTIGQPYPSSDKSQAPTPSAPSMMTWVLNLPDNQPIWKAGSQVRYAVSFVSGEVESNLSAWCDPSTVQGYMCPELSLPTDTTGWASARKVYRQFDSGTQEVVGIILDNSTTVWVDSAPQWNFPSPPQLGAPDGSLWAQRSNSNNTQVFIPNQLVQYAVSYVFNGAETQLSPWCDAITINFWGNPTFTDVPVFPDQGVAGFPECTGRNLYRQCMNQSGDVVQKPTLVAQLNDNTTTEVTDPMP